MALEIFRLFGTIMVNNDEANRSIANTESRAEGLGNRLISGIATAGKWAAGIAAAAGTAAIALGTLAVNSADNFSSALNKLQVQTGATNKDMEQFEDIVKNVYADNFGESFEDVANNVALVKQNCGLMGEELKRVTELAIGFKDAFGVETEESTRAVKAMMDQFGISAEEAFNLMVQGQQKGLNYSDELIDNINEYSVQFGKLGLNAEDMFNVFQSGSDAGAFSLDKIGDAVKEFSIRAIDGSDTTIDGFTRLGLNADEMARKFAQGGTSAKEAFYKTIEAIKSMEDPISQSTVGVELFGTMWEDLGPQVVTQLGNVKEAYDKTKNSAEEMNSIQYNSFGEAVEGIKRQVETNILLPLGESILPMLNKFANWFATKGVEYIDKFSTFIMTILPPIWEVFSNIFDGITFIVSSFFSSFTSSADGIGFSWNKLMDILSGLWQEIGAPLFDTISSIITNLLTYIGPIFEQIKVIWGLLVDYYKVAWETVGKPIFDFFIEIVNKLVDVFNYVMPILINIFSGLMDSLNIFWENIGKPIFYKIKDILENILLPIWRFIFDNIAAKVKSVFDNIASFWNNTLKPIFDGIINFISGIFRGEWSKAWEGVKSIFSGIWGGIKNIVKNAWDFILSLFSNGGKIFKGIAEAIGSIFKKIVNGIISGINFVIAQPFDFINGILNTIRKIDILGFTPFDGLWDKNPLPVPQIPMLAKGGVVDGATLALIGEAGKEAVVPLERNTEWMDRLSEATSKNKKNEIKQEINIYCKTESPSEIARKFKQSQRELGMAW